MGGSAYSMAQQIGSGHILVTERTFVRLQRPELDQLSFEMEKLLRELRGSQVDLADTLAVQKKNRSIARMNGALGMLRGYRQRRKIR